MIFAVVDGRTSMSSGLFNQTWAEWLDISFDLSEAIGLDGGGSSTLSVHDCWLNDVVNFPSDSGNFSHQGARAVGSGLYLSLE
jgi:exopolysaccharide biosynthesis protein